MIDRVAKALFMQSVYHGYDDETIKREWQRTKGLHRSAARTAIEAMREPTDDMLDAIGPVADRIKALDEKPDDRMIDTQIWQAVIDAALK